MSKLPPLLSLVAALLVLPAKAQDAPTLASLQDKKRVLLVFAPNAQNASFQRQIKLLMEAAPATQERDLVVIPVVEQEKSPSSGEATGSSLPPFASGAEAPRLRQRFHAAPADFLVILIGKDGREKLRRHAPISISKLSSTIDAMPMRKDEMRRNKPASTPAGNSL